MLRSTCVSDEEPRWRLFADTITVSNFAVVKDSKSDRMITWPRIRSRLFASQPSIDLSDPHLFKAIIAHSNDKDFGVTTDVAKMFHNIILPRWIAFLFPLSTVCIVDMPSSLRNYVIKSVCLAKRPKKCERFRPHQETLPMGLPGQYTLPTA